MSLHWIDDADHWICPVCKFETGNPAKYEGCKCPKCGFQDDKDKVKSEEGMTKEEAIKRLKEARNTIQPFRYVDEAIDYAIKALEQEPCKDEGGWTPVSERLPEEPGEYLITWTGILGEHSTKRSKPLMAIAEYEIYEPENYADWITAIYEFEYYHDIKVLAWMPLPESYKPQESEE